LTKIFPSNALKSNLIIRGFIVSHDYRYGPWQSVNIIEIVDGTLEAFPKGILPTV